MERRMTPPCNGGEGARDMLLKKIMQLDFALYETNLYLDVYPCSTDALEHFERLKKVRAAAAAQYETQFGPLTACGNVGSEWNWIKSPWPWEYEGN